MPLPVFSQLNTQTFFKYWAVRAFDPISCMKLSSKDRARAQVLAVALAVLTLSVGTWICHLCLFDRKIVSYSHRLKSQIRRLEKIFAGTNDKKKIKEINRVANCEYYDRLKNDKFLNRADEDYCLFKNLKTKIDFDDFIAKYSSKFESYKFSSYANIRRTCNQINRGKKITINDHNFSLLFSFCDFKKLSSHILQGNYESKSRFIEHLSNLEYLQFKEKYHVIRNLILQHRMENPFLSRSFIELQHCPGKVMACACEVLEALNCEPKERKLKLALVKQIITTLPLFGNFFWRLLAQNCQPNDVSTLISMDFNIEYESIIKRGEFVQHIINKNWNQYLIPNVWNYFDEVYLDYEYKHHNEYPSINSQIIEKSLASKEQFTFLFNHLCNSSIPYKDSLITQCLVYTKPAVPLLIRQYRFEVVKDSLWPLCIKWLEKPSPDKWLLAPFNYKQVVAPLNKYFLSLETHLQKLLFDFKTKTVTRSIFNVDSSHLLPEVHGILLDKLHPDSQIDFMLTSKAHYKLLSLHIQQSLKNNIQDLISLVHQFNQKHLTLFDTLLVENIEELEALLKCEDLCNAFPPDSWFYLSDWLDTAFFHALMSNSPLRLFTSTKK